MVSSNGKLSFPQHPRRPGQEKKVSAPGAGQWLDGLGALSSVNSGLFVPSDLVSQVG